MNAMKPTATTLLEISDAKKKAIDEILAERDAARVEIYAKAAALIDRAEEIKDRGYDRPLTAAEIKELGDVYAAHNALGMTETELVLMTVRALAQSVEAKRLQNVLAAVNKDLEKKLKKIGSTVEALETAAKVIQIIEKIVQGLARLAAMVP